MNQPVAIVTGASAGIGAAVVTTLTERGYRVAGFDVRPPTGAAADHHHVDVSDAAQVRDAVKSVASGWGRLDLVVNNAGILDVHSVEDTPEDVWDRVMAVNVKSIYLMSQAAMPALRDSSGVIVNVSSVHAVASVPRAAAYAASKGAVLSLSRQMALDCADDGVRVTAVVVGSVNTAMSADHGARMARDGVVTSPPPGRIGRSAEPVEIARVIAFLASPDGSFVVGSPVVVDGGLLSRLM